MTEAVAADLSLGSGDPVSSEMPEAATITHAELIRRVALIHAAIDECEMQAMEESAMKKRAEERDR
jgi:hypothetical protein